MIAKQLEQIKKEVLKQAEDERYSEVAIWLIDDDESKNFIIDAVSFNYKIDDTWLMVNWDGGDKETGPIMYSHLVKIDQIRYITDEV